MVPGVYQCVEVTSCDVGGMQTLGVWPALKKPASQTVVKAFRRKQVNAAFAELHLELIVHWLLHHVYGIVLTSPRLIVKAFSLDFAPTAPLTVGVLRGN